MTTALPILAAVIIGYVFPKDGVIDPAAIAADRLTHVNYAFANVADGCVVEGFAKDAENYRVLAGLRRKHPHLRILVSVGGWDQVSQAPFLWNSEKKIFVTFDDPESLRIKSRYVRERRPGRDHVLGVLLGPLGNAPRHAREGAARPSALMFTVE